MFAPRRCSSAVFDGVGLLIRGEIFSRGAQRTHAVGDKYRVPRQMWKVIVDSVLPGSVLLRKDVLVLQNNTYVEYQEIHWD